MKMTIKMFPGFGWIETLRSKFGPILTNKVPILIITVVLLFSYSSMKKNQKDSADF